MTAPLTAEHVLARVREALALVRQCADETIGSPSFVHLVCLQGTLQDAEHQASKWLEREHAERNP